MRRHLCRCLSFAAALLLFGTEASALVTISGLITPASPTMTVVQIDEPDCGAQSGMAVRYDARTFTAPVSGKYIVSLSSSQDRAAFYVYRSPFNPASGTVNCIGAAHLGIPKRIAVDLRRGASYTFVVFDNSLSQAGDIAYTLTVSAVIKPHVDFSDDGSTDMVIVRNEGGTSRWWVLDSVALEILQFTWGAPSDVFLTGDLNGDGAVDPIIWRPGPVGTAAFWIKYLLGTGLLFRQFGQTGDDPRVTRDYEDVLDGLPDLAVYRAGSAPGLASTWFYLGNLLVGTLWGLHGDTPVPGDFDGDVKGDFVVRRDAGGGSAVFLMKLSTGGVSGGFASIFFGTSTDLVVPGDYDGDGKTDLAIVRDAGGAMQWWIRRSSDGAIVSQTFGVSTDVPVPGDYDGDGKSDVAVWRPGNPGVFWVSKSSGGLLIRVWGMTGDYPVANWIVH